RVHQFFFFSSRRRHTRFSRDWSSDVCSSDLALRRGRFAVNILSEEQESLSQYFAGDKDPSVEVRLDKRARAHSPIIEGALAWLRSEERRVGKECRSWWAPSGQKRTTGAGARG